MKTNDVIPVPCAAWAEKLAAQPADLTAEGRAALASHVLTCPACASVQAAYRAMDASILALPSVAALTELPYLDGMATESPLTEDRHKAPTSSPQPPPVPTGRRERGRIRSRRWVRLASGVAAVLVVGALLSGFLFLFNAHHTLVGGNAGAHTIFAASDEGDGTVYALRPSDGALYWQYSIGQKLTGALISSNDTLYVGSYNNHVYALRKSDGSLRWTSPVSIGDATSPTFVDNTAVYVSSTSAIYALSVTDGHLLWSRPAPHCNTCVGEFIAINGATLYAYLDGLYALHSSDGKILWHHPELSFSNRSFAVINGKIYVPGGHTGILYELRASDGKQLKTLTFQQDEPLEMVAANGVMYVDSAGHDVYAIRASDDTTLWHKRFDDLRLGLSGPADGAIYFAQNISSVGSTQSNSSDIYALNTSNGSQRWGWSPSQSFGVSPVTGFDGVAYFFSGSDLYALNAANGKQLWQVSEGDRLNSLIIG
ncbi:MAG TPA: PQQ-binding-like beta-propeller repeat protein [Ktedonobacteraceae bacterium]